MWTLDQKETIAKAIREEIVRQYRDDERRTCPAGAYYYEDQIAPFLIAEAVEKLSPVANQDRSTHAHLRKSLILSDVSGLRLLL